MNNDLAQNAVSHKVDAREFEINYPEAALAHKLKIYGFNPKTAYKKISVNVAKIANSEGPENIQSHYLQLLADALIHWKPSADFSSFTAQINQLIYLWLNAIQDGVETRYILNLLQCVDCKGSFGLNASPTIQLFLYDLLAESSIQQQEYAMSYILNYDENTNLPNANQIIFRLIDTLEHSSQNQYIGVFSLHFQATRNHISFTKSTALNLNKQISQILQRNLLANSQLFFNGDSQFDIIVPNLSGGPQATLFAAKISRAFEEMLFVESQSVLMFPFIGAALSKSNELIAKTLHANAKLALQNAITRQQSFALYTSQLEKQIGEESEIEAKVLEAFGSDNLTLFFQPIVNLKDNTCAGAELLLRWTEKFNYNVYPSVTVEILNKVGKGKLFTRWLVNSACRYVSELIYEHKLNVYLTINLRAEDLHDIELPHLLMQAIALWKLKPKDIVLEITENGILEYNESSTSVINQLAENGYVFALDDFGTGFSSLSRLRTMPIDLIKIDQSFVRNITESREDFEIVQSIAMLSKSLGKEVLVEGVEDEASLNLVKKLNIDKCQGYFFAKPMSFESFVAWAKAQNSK